MAADHRAADTQARLVVAAVERLHAPIADAALVRVEAHAWPDTPFGCPEPGWQYALVLTAGYVVVARTADGLALTLHTDEDGRTIVCSSG
jgi:hypothetical protein